MNRIKYAGLMYDRIKKEDWEFEGGETNPDLLKLQHPKRERKGYRYFRLRPLQPGYDKQEAIEETEYEAAMRKWRETGKLD
ncbi:MAG: hypothetical protein E6Q24_14905 [Chitinophagaceae bacterium]|nr:MAG: hypothetical protein E6Q24_14905 [Chitinophagaceae bacterium]